MPKLPLSKTWNVLDCNTDRAFWDAFSDQASTIDLTEEELRSGRRVLRGRVVLRKPKKGWRVGLEGRPSAVLVHPKYGGPMYRVKKKQPERRCKPVSSGPDDGTASDSERVRNQLRPFGIELLPNLLGQGSCGIVLHARRSHDGHHQLVAVKLLKSRGGSLEEANQECLRETRYLAAAQGHPNVVKLLSSTIQWNPPRTPILVLELATGTLHSALRSDDHDPEERLRKIGNIDPLEAARHMFRALARVHGRHLVHRDVKPDNWADQRKLVGRTFQVHGRLIAL